MNRFLLCLCHLQYLTQWHPVNLLRFVETQYQCAFSGCLRNGFREFNVLQQILRPGTELHLWAEAGSCYRAISPFPVDIKVYCAIRDVHLEESDLLFDTVNHKMSGKLGWCKPPVFEFEFGVNPKHDVGVLIVVSAQTCP